jgi:hypothetical protein
MHRQIEITVVPEQTRQLLDRLQKIEAIIVLTLDEKASIKPPGDVVRVQVLNRGADDVMRAAQETALNGRVIVSTSDLESISDPERQEEIEDDTDDELWEEIETGLRQTTHITANYVMLMALGGMIAASGLFMHGLEQAIAFVAASIIAPGFEPIAKIPVGLTLRSWGVAKRALISFGAGYAVLIGVAGATFAAFLAFGVGTTTEIASNADVRHVMANATPENVLSFCGAFAGIIMLTSYREEVIAGPLLALGLIPSSALAAGGLVSGSADLFRLGLTRLTLDLGFIFGIAAVFMFLKQRLVHKRKAMV